MIGITGALIWSKTQMELVFNFVEVRRAQLVKSTLLTSTLVPLGFSRNCKVCSGAKEREWGAESNRKIPHVFIPSKTAEWIPQFAVDDISLSRIAA